MITEISTAGLINSLGKNGFTLIDARSPDAYNGWRLKNEPRGGHIRTARNLPLKWTKYIDWIEMVRRKGILPGQSIVVYGYGREEALTVAERFLDSGYSQVSVYPRFIEEWSADPGLPMDHLQRYPNLVPASWVNSLISGDANRRFLVVHAHYRNREAYLSGHIPGAIDLDTLALESPETWNRRSPEELKRELERHGITHDTMVIMYGKFMFPDNNDPFPGSAAGDIAAMRCAFILMYAGVEDVRVLNGGFQSWTDEGYEISYTDRPKTTVKDFGAEIPVNPRLAVDTPEAKQILASASGELVCVRSPEEYAGRVSGYNYIEARGRIPGAVFADCGSDAYHMENYRNFDHTMREYHEVAAIWKKIGITPGKKLAFYCGTGWRGSEAWFNAWLMGWPDVSVYDGGWFEWSSDPDNPFETGEPAVTGNGDHETDKTQKGGL
jgi:molybdopterin synthase sulfurtransferase